MPSAYKKIADYGIVGNGVTVAHIGLDGSIDWMCLPYLDSPSVFAALLDIDKGGRFCLQPCTEWDSSQHYVDRTNILITRFRTATGEVELTDFMAVNPDVEDNSLTRSLLIRRVRGVQGILDVGVELTPRFQYATLKPEWDKIDDNRRLARTDNEQLHLYISKVFNWQNERTTLSINKGETIWLCIYYGEVTQHPDTALLEQLLRRTKDYWRQWVTAQETGKYPTKGFWQRELDRSALVLKLLQFRETGAIAAAASCSLPTIIYGKRNWDYRFSWVRDTSLTLQAFFETGHVREVEQYLGWIKNILKKKDCTNLEVLYKLREPEPPDGETPLDYLHGYKGSQPVLIGQYNVGQHQHDIYGELLDMVFSLSRLVGKIDLDYWNYLHQIVEHVAQVWRDRDNGIWELRTGPHHVTHSKVMCWVALDRGIKMAEHYGFPADLQYWKKERDAVHADVLARAYNTKRQRFTQHYDTEALDAALLQMVLVGFLPAKDERILNTIRAIETELMVDGLPLRYTVDDGISGQEHGWLICYFWYLRCLIRLNELDAVEAHLRRVGRFGNHLGLFGEEYDPTFQEITGNFPQAFSHIGYIATILEYLDARHEPPEPAKIPSLRKIQMVFKRCNLTPPASGSVISTHSDPGADIKRIMNILRGQFYDGQQQRIDYFRIRDSAYYHVFLRAVTALRSFDPAQLRNDTAKIAFWLNVFNTLVIHGVIELGISESVKEVPFFFERVTYRVFDHDYTLSDIEHGILRGNKIPPFRIFKRLRNNDPRLVHTVVNPDARIHFGLVCASRTCPPIEVYSEESLDEQLETSAKVFINSTTCLDRKHQRLFVSEIFKWYRDDFSATEEDLVLYIADYLYDREQAEWLRKNHTAIDLVYSRYDWRLNR